MMLEAAGLGRRIGGSIVIPAKAGSYFASLGLDPRVQLGARLKAEHGKKQKLDPGLRRGDDGGVGPALSILTGQQWDKPGNDDGG